VVGFVDEMGMGRGRMLLARDSDSVLCAQMSCQKRSIFFFKKGQQNAGQRCFDLLAIS